MVRTAWSRRPTRARRRLTDITVAAGLCLLTVACTSGPGRQPAGEPGRQRAGQPSPPVTSAPSATRPISPPLVTHSSRTQPPTSVANPAGLTDEQLVGQLFIGYVYGAGASSATAAQRRANLALYGAATGAEIVRRWHLGGIILIGRNDLDPNRPELYSDNVD